ncbi:MAG: class I SAM-dependent methyltransferase [bacterium]|nr:class I SAM-dependent methyltransferase [bacterium]
MPINEYKKFYESVDRGKYASGKDLSNDLFYKEFSGFIKKYGLENGKALEIGSGNGKYQDIIGDYTGADISDSLSNFYHKRYVVLEENEKYPFLDQNFDLVFTTSVFEHIPNIEFSLKETLRVLENKGYLFFHMAWQVRPWAADGYAVRPYSDFGLKGKLIKALVPLRENMFFRICSVMPKRIIWALGFILNRNNFRNELKYKKLKPNYETFWSSDSDACNSVDPFAMILYFRANNCKIMNYSNPWKAFFVRSGILMISKNI